MLRKFWTAVESIVGLLATFMIGFTPPVLLFFGIFVSGDLVIAGPCLAGCLLTGWLAWRVAKLASIVVEQKGSLWPPDPPDLPKEEKEVFRIEDPPLPPTAPPLALAMAHELPRLSSLARGALGMWWLGHFALAVVAGHFSAQWIVHVVNPQAQAIVFVIGVFFHFAFLFAANLYLLLATAVLAPRPEIWEQLWSYRFLIDFLLALGSTMLPQLMG